MLVARVHALLQGGKASLLWYKPQGAGLYCLEVEGQWTEPTVWWLSVILNVTVIILFSFYL